MVKRYIKYLKSLVYIDNLNIQKAFLQQLFDDAPVSIALVDNNWNITKINNEFVKMFEYSPKELIGNWFYNIKYNIEKFAVALGNNRIL